MKSLKFRILSISIGLFIASCNNCTTKNATGSDSSTTVSGSSTSTITAADTTASTNNAGETNSQAGNNSNTVNNSRVARKASDSVDYSTYSTKTKSNNIKTAPVNNPPKGTFGNSVGQDN